VKYIKNIIALLGMFFRLRIISFFGLSFRYFLQFFVLRLADKKRFWRYRFRPELFDCTENTKVDLVYILQDRWFFEHILRDKPSFHIDVGSNVPTMALASLITKIEFVDIRAVDLPQDVIGFKPGNILALPYKDDELSSISSLCVIEHIGLGRYGDDLDFAGSELAIAEVTRVLKPGGLFYLSIPVDDINTVYFNAHRAFEVSYLKRLLENYEILDEVYLQNGELYETKELDGFGISFLKLKLKDKK
jgi:SAM-dependent methyltransferase